MPKKKRRQFTPEFKAEAVRLVREGLSQAQVGRDLGINPGTLGQWVKLLEDLPKGSEAVDLEEVRRLRKRVAQLEEEREILKKAAAYFAKESN